MIWSESLLIDVRTLAMWRQREAFFFFYSLPSDVSIAESGDTGSKHLMGGKLCTSVMCTGGVSIWNPTDLERTERARAVLEEEKWFIEEWIPMGRGLRQSFPWALGATSRARILSYKLPFLFDEMVKKDLFSFRRCFRGGYYREGVQGSTFSPLCQCSTVESLML